MNFLQRVIQADSVSQRTRIFIQDPATGLGKTGLAFNTAGLTAYYSNGPSDTANVIALVTNTVGGAWASGGFVEVDATHEPGMYQFDIPNASIVSGHGGEAQIHFHKAATIDFCLDITLSGYNPLAIDRSNMALSDAANLAIFNQLTSAMVAAGSIGKLLADNIATTKAATDGIKTKTDALTLTAGAVTVAPHGLDTVIGYHPAGDA